MKRFNKLLSLILVLSLILPGVVFAENEVPSNQELSNSVTEMFEKADVDRDEYFTPEQEVRIVVELDSNPGIVHATRRGVEYSELSMAEINDIERNIFMEQETVKNSISRITDMEYINDFHITFNGFSGNVKYGDIKSIEALPSVKKVYIANEYNRPEAEINMVTSNDMVYSQLAWAAGYEGEGTVVSIIDTGIDPGHKDMVLSEGTTPKLEEKDIEEAKLERGKYFTKKVPFGYNYYDLNNQILDFGSGPHGMHVAGTVGANGDTNNGGIKGVAPEAQLLAMKVFSNDPIYATTFSDIYLKAIEDSIKLGVDALNMSLGSTASFFIDDSPEDVAITNAVENGVVCLISAGNSGYNVYGTSGAPNYGFPTKENPDVGVVGGPSLNTDSISIASVENTNQLVNQLSYKVNGKKQGAPMSIAGSIDPSRVFTNEVEVIDAGFGAPEDFEDKDLKGKVALMMRGVAPGSSFSGAFTDKIINAQKAGAAGAIIYNHQSGGEELISMQYPDTGIIPAVFIGYSHGIGILNMGGTTPVLPSNSIILNPNAYDIRFLNSSSKAQEELITTYNKKLPIYLKLNTDLIVDILGNKTGLDKLPETVKYSDVNGTESIRGFTESVGTQRLIKFESEMLSVVNPKGGLMSDFTSWGTTPSLEMKPELTAPGGQIYSTFNNDKYGIMSGTSMAAPHVAGGSAIVMQYLKQDARYSDLTPQEQARLAKVLLMNTATPVVDEYEVEVSPRRQGAGTMNVNAAVNTPVRIVNVDTNEAKFELRDFEDKSFTMNFIAINDSDEDLTYAVDTTVLKDIIDTSTPVALNVLESEYVDATIDGESTITIPAKGRIEFSIEVDFSKDKNVYRNMFIEGFVRFEDAREGELAVNPTLGVPFIGFYGDWGEPKVVDNMRFLDEEGTSYFNTSGILRFDENDSGYYYTDGVFLSPETDSGKKYGTDSMLPYISFLRNAEIVKYNVLDKDGDLLRTIAIQNFVRKHYRDGSRARALQTMIKDAQWDGTVNGERLSDGEYIFEIQSKIHYKGAEIQSKQIPVIIDTTKPIVKDLVFNSENADLSWEVEEKGSGIMGFDIYLNDKLATSIKGNLTQNKYKVNIAKNLVDGTAYEIAVVAYDRAFNEGRSTVKTDVGQVVPEIYIYSPSLLEVYKERTIVFDGFVTNFELLDEVAIGDIGTAEFEYREYVELPHPDDSTQMIYAGPAYYFYGEFELEDGYHEIPVVVKSSTGNEGSITRRFYVDTTPATLEIKNLGIVEGSDKVTFEITMKDNFPYLKLYKGDSQIFSYDNLGPGNIKETIIIEQFIVDLVDGENEFVFTLIDASGREVEETITITKESAEKFYEEIPSIEEDIETQENLVLPEIPETPEIEQESENL
ncbi:S8 family serine peptidase [Tissierella pigra]|uniref:S8 family serine peptidase n=1 Tax=Tissierella pigra TaxID=2607614 RepID=A0A6N7XFY9_9FIRM|nr:S8 family serine peptidase [Tissierella pigra]MSU00626.1 S8 family serine peptidase [Tissierella pigra]